MNRLMAFCFFVAITALGLGLLIVDNRLDALEEHRCPSGWLASFERKVCWDGQANYFIHNGPTDYKKWRLNVRKLADRAEPAAR